MLIPSNTTCYDELRRCLAYWGLGSSSLKSFRTIAVFIMQNAVAKRDFGSFQSSNVQELLQLPEEEYVAPDIKIELPEFVSSKSLEIEFGLPAKRKYFLLEEECTFLNHGAFGAVLSNILDLSHRWQKYMERQPLRFLDKEIFPHLVYVTRRLAKFVGCDPTDILLVTNVTTATNSILRGIKFKPGDIIYSLNLTYGAVKKLLKHIAEETGAIIQEETIIIPIEGAHQIINKVKSTIKSGTKIAVFDHVPSNAPFIMPIKELIAVCHERSVPVFIDGAHALGSLPINLHDIGADYYSSNAHKWFCSPKGAAFLYVRKELQKSVRPLVISHGFGSGFNSEFMWSGLKDYSPFLVLPTIIDFWEAVGLKKMRGYMYNLTEQAANMLVERLGTRLGAPVSMFGTMALVALPKRLYTNREVNYDLAESIQKKLSSRFSIEVPIKSIQGILYVRISCHIHNEISEYEYLAECLLKLDNE
ncbi:putative L-cysteine desulfhydrase 1 [Anneissia japonica]|uniref:putative L-cysteine desulfhydrase 1 n=1 Tax=Anneissia japonica TaxID=1529436 RepID=UPI001425965C|nr:putative L-cysteine desulfhydrase 1 [Anneissia japonica]